MLRSLTQRFALTAALVLSATTATAQTTGLTASFRDRVGAGNATDNFDVWVRLTLDANAAAFHFDGSDIAGNFGLPTDLLPTNGRYQDGSGDGTFDTYTYASPSIAFLCSGTFTSSCVTGPPYTFQWNGAPWSGSTAIDIAPGQSMDFLFGTFAPDGGSAPAGTYRFFGAYATMYFVGVDASGKELSTWSTVARTCPGVNDDSCAFIRTVTGAAVPEPASWLLLAPALAGVLSVRRRRTR